MFRKKTFLKIQGGSPIIKTINNLDLKLSKYFNQQDSILFKIIPLIVLITENSSLSRYASQRNCWSY